MIEINLIPDVKQELIKAQRMRAAVISGSILASIIAGGVVVLLLLYVFGIQTVRGNLLNTAIEDGAAELAEVEDLSKILTIKNQLAQISNLKAEKDMNSRIFDMLSAVTPTGNNEVRFSQIALDDETATIRLEGQTRGYDSMEVFKKTVSSAVIEYTEAAPVTDSDAEADEQTETAAPETKTTNLASDISISDVSYGEDATGQRVLRFVLSFKYADVLFAQTTTNPAFKLSVNGNVTDSYLGIPKGLFTDRARDL